MKRAACTMTMIAILAGGNSLADAARPGPVTSVTASVSCSSNTSTLLAITPVDANDAVTGATLTIGCGQYSPASASESVTAGTTQWNYSGFFYPIGASTTTSLLGRVTLGKTVRASIKGARTKFSLVAS